MNRTRLVSGSSADAFTGNVLAAMLDEVDYPMLLLSRQLRVLHCNAAAAEQARVGGGVDIDEELGLTASRDRSALARAVEVACGQGKRSFIQLRGGSGGLMSVSVVPVASVDQPHAALLIMGRSSLCQELSLHGFARESLLTEVETRVLRLLCAGLSVQDIAAAHDVKISTIRSQMASLRTKTGAKDIRDVVFKLAVLPPVVSALRPTSAWGA